jgi:hypothetical protein
VPPAPTAVPKNADAPPRSRLSDCKGRGIATACGGGYPRERPAAEPAPNQMLQNMFGG